MINKIKENQNFILYDVGRIVRKQYYECHDYYVLVFTITGENKIEVGGGTYHLSKDGACLIYPGTLYKIYSTNPDKNYRIYFKPNSLGCSFLSTPSFSKIKKLLDQEANLAFFKHFNSYEFMKKISSLEFNFNFENTLRLLDIFHFLSNQKKDIVLPTDKTSVKSLSSYTRIINLINHLEENIEKVNSLSDAASMCLMSESKFSKTFKMITGSSYKHYLIEMRLFKAYKLLINSDMSIYEISLQVGFPTISNFNTQFRKMFDIAPSYLRNERYFIQLLDSKSYPDITSRFNLKREEKI